ELSEVTNTGLRTRPELTTNCCPITLRNLLRDALTIGGGRNSNVPRPHAVALSVGTSLHSRVPPARRSAQPASEAAISSGDSGSSAAGAAASAERTASSSPAAWPTRKWRVNHCTPRLSKAPAATPVSTSIAALSEATSAVRLRVVIFITPNLLTRPILPRGAIGSLRRPIRFRAAFRRQDRTRREVESL